MRIKHLLSDHYKAVISTLFFVAMLLLWGFWLPEVTAYHEQTQMFLFTPDYFTEHLPLPGALADYASEFLVQFSFFVLWGAAVTALLLTLMQRVVWAVMRQCGACGSWYATSLVLPALLAAQCTDPDTMPTFTLSLLAALSLSWLRLRLRHSRWSWAVDVVVLPLFYWVAGPVVAVPLCAAVVCAVVPQLRDDSRSTASPLKAAAAIAATALTFWLTGRGLHYSWESLLKGIFYYRQPATLPLAMDMLMALAALLPMIAAAVSHIRRRSITVPAVYTLLIASGALIGCGTQRAILEVIGYGYLVRMGHYADIISKSTRTAPRSEVGVAATNLALSATGEMPDRMFEFRQFGTNGLIPDANLDANTTMMAGEIFLHLGMVNQAQRYFFESQEAVPGYKRSSQCYRRLAETNLVNADYRVAARYLRLLSHTLFYRSWAEKRLAWATTDHRAVADDPEYARLRSLRPTDDYLFGMSETDLTLGALYMHNKQNHAALEYLMAYELLAHNAQRFMQYFPLVLKAGPSYIPRSYQEGIAIFTMNDAGNPLAACVDATTKRQLTDFLGIYSKDKAAAAHYEKPPFADTYWFYLFASKPQGGEGGADNNATPGKNTKK